MGAVAILKHHPDNLLHAQMEPRRTIKFSPNFTNSPSHFTASDSRRRTPPKGILKKKERNTKTEPPVKTVSKNLVMGQVKILKRGEALNESSTILDDRKLSNGASSTPEKEVVATREASKNQISVLPSKKKAEEKKRLSDSSPINEDLTLSSTHRLGPDPAIVSKHMKNIAECFAGSAYSDSPHPSSVPLPGFFKRSFGASVKDDATTNLRRILGLSLI